MKFHMKTNCVRPLHGWWQLVGGLVNAGALLLLGLTAMGQAAPKSPVGTWDVVMSGVREGLAVMTFYANDTFDITEILVPKQTVFSMPDNNQRNAGDTGRGITPVGTNSTSSLPPHINLYGEGTMHGQWGFDGRGRVIGYYYEANDTVTNQLSFVGTVVPNKRLSLLVSSPSGKITYSGVPDVQLPDLSGNYYGIERDGYLWYTEFFTLSPMPLSPNVYALQGAGPAYNFSGIAIACPQKKLATGVSIVNGVDTNNTVRAVVGPWNPKRMNGTLHGLKGQDANNTTRLTYTLQRQ